MLAAFTADDWPGRTVADSFALWREARHLWLDERGWPGGAVELLVEERRVRRGLAGFYETHDSRRRRS